jgi:hypothetical protein
MKHSRVFQFAAIFTTAIFLVGCGGGRPSRVPVSGEVYIDGKPLAAGTVMLVPKGARPSSGAIDAQGHFTLTCYDGKDGAVPGKHAVAVVGMQQIDAKSQRWLAPQKYADHRTSGLEATIDGATDSLRIDLTWAGGAPFVEKIDP